MSVGKLGRLEKILLLTPLLHDPHLPGRILLSTPVLLHRPMPRLARPPIAVSVTLFSRLYSTGLGSSSDISSRRTSGLRTLSVDAQPFGAILLWPTSWGPLAAVKACKSDAYSSTKSSTSIEMTFVTRSGPRAARGSNSYRHNPLPRS